MDGGKGLVLVVEDEAPIAELVRRYLTREGFGVRHVEDGGAALSEVARTRPVAIVLDIALPTRDGIEICRALRAGGDWTPVLFLSARGDEADRITGLELGADDYLTKPFSPRELVSRIKAVLRRSAGEQGARSLSVGAVELDLHRRSVHAGGAPVALTATEFDLLAHLMRAPGRVYSREALLSAVWGYAAGGGTRTVDVHVAQVRSKLGAHSPIRTVRGVGYAAEG